MPTARRDPRSAIRELETELPPEWVGAGRSVRPLKNSLRLDVDADADFEIGVPKSKPKVVEFDVDGVERRLLVFHRAERWFAAPADLLGCSHGGRRLEFLDVDADGRFDGPRDFVRWQQPTFQRVGDERLLASRKGLIDFAIVGEDDDPRLELVESKRPDFASKDQWAALLHLNARRAEAGLGPWILDAARTAACQSHAEYLSLNDFDYRGAWDGVGSHAQDPDAPGYSPEGHEAAQRSNTQGTDDAQLAVDVQLRTLLHRIGFLGRAGHGLGIGLVDEARGSAVPGYCVLWIQDPQVTDLDALVVYPAPGQEVEDREAEEERPPIQELPGHYVAERGLPISVTFGQLELRDVQLTVFDERTDEPLAGECFTPERPVHSTRPENARSALFLPDEPLTKRRRWRAEFTAESATGPVFRTWTFET